MRRPRWMAHALKERNFGAFTRLVRRRYGARGFTTSPVTGERVIRPTVVAKLRRDPDPHVRGMADFAYNTPAAKRLRAALAAPKRRHRA